MAFPMEEKTTQLEVENQAEIQTPEIETTQTVEDTDESVESTPDGGDNVKEEGVDYEAELTLLQDELTKKEEIISHKNRAIEAMKRKTRSQEDEEEIDNELPDEKIRQRVDELFYERLAVSQTRERERLIKSRATSDAHEKLIKYHLEHSVKLTGDVEEDVANAAYLADRKRVTRNLKAAQDALISKQTAGGAEFGGRKIQTKPEPVYNSRERALLQRFGALSNSKK